MIRAKTFFLALSYYYTDIRKMKSFLNDKRITAGEKRILECWTLLSKNDFEEITKQLLNQSPSNDQVVEGQKNLLLGICYNHQGECLKATSHLNNCLIQLSHPALHSHKISALSNLFMCYLNLKDIEQMESVLQVLEKEKLQTTHEKIRLLRCQFNHMTFLGVNDQALEILQQIDQLKNEMSDNQIIFHLIDKFDFLIKTDRPSEAKEILSEMQIYRSFRLSANYSFMKILTDHLLENQPIYINDKYFVPYPMLHWQLKVLEQLECGDRNNALIYWDKLRQWSPQIYDENFQYFGDKCIFSLCLEKRLKSESTEISIEKNFSPMEEKLIKLLQTSGGQINKESCYEKLFGSPLKEKEELFKLSIMVSRIRKKHGLNIRSKKGHYIFTTEHAIKKAS